MRISFYKALLRHWLRMVLGQSYWHASQGVGLHFNPGELSDYYRDYSSKAIWKGAQDPMGFPLVQEPGGEVFYHPLVLSQKALGHWSKWLAASRNDSQELDSFLKLAEWLRANQEVHGGWRIPSMEKPVYTVPYSALAQGQAISVLARAFSVTSKPTMIEAAQKGFNFMMTSVQKGGTARWSSEGVILEEYPQRIPNTVLNGWVSALYGIYDYWLLDKQQAVRDSILSSVEALKTYLPRYNAGFWSLYDTSGTIASPYYHRVHIVQLRALEQTFPCDSTIFQQFRVQFERQLASTSNFLRAFCRKGWQKLKTPPTTVLVQPKSQAVITRHTNVAKNRLV